MADTDWTTELRDFADLKPRRSLATEAADTLREFILLGKLPPGAAVPERDLSEAFGISRTPLKEALRILEMEGLIVYGPTRRPRVADPSLDQINDWLRVQGALEALAGELACHQASDAQLAGIDQANKAFLNMKSTGRSLESFRLDMAFHDAIVAASGNAALAGTHETYNARLWRARFLSSQHAASRDVTEREHQTIVDALLARDTQAARQALRRHLRTAEANVPAALAKIKEQDAP